MTDQMTPGPWKADSSGNILAGEVNERHDDGLMHHTFELVAMMPEAGRNRANARAIAALPDLVEAARNMEITLTTPPAPEGPSQDARMVSAINKFRAALARMEAPDAD